ncbi:FAD-binding domain-containing protein [uncultured Halovibrio sp.]|uniref:cryptochrome/photolyase family protein n=1 Tax=uncultured Halovibrio sp. TaxID=985049 RepID=UPI0025D89175|nr:FAD-binding domain-containing protein [uncultured Halovibrio sp.]
MTELIWFRNDLRLGDNPALTAACAGNAAVEACFLPAPGQWADHDWSPNRTDLLLRSLDQLGQDLAALGIPLHIRSIDRFTDTDTELLALCRERGITRIHANEEYAFNERIRDHRLTGALIHQGIALHIYRDQTVVPVDQLKTGNGTPYTVFTPYSRQWWRWVESHPPRLYPAPAARGAPLPPPALPELTAWRSEHVDWLAGGEGAAHRALEGFIDQRLGAYADQRNYPAVPATSLISPYLALGVLSPRQCLVAVQQRTGAESPASAAHTWLNEIAWRDFYIQLLYQFPRLSRHQAFKPETEALPWEPAGANLEAWKAGRTGIPLVDAAMRQLNTTGWMHNRLRMVTAMFLTKNLFVDWRLGEQYFMQQLVDGYLPSNNGGWQWSASTGTDAAPYFRIFNPVTQSERFDPEGTFIRHWVPEIAHLQGKKLFNPNGTVAGYPAPIVDLKQSRQRAIERFKALGKG